MRIAAYSCNSFHAEIEWSEFVLAIDSVRQACWLEEGNLSEKRLLLEIPRTENQRRFSTHDKATETAIDMQANIIGSC